MRITRRVFAGLACAIALGGGVVGIIGKVSGGGGGGSFGVSVANIWVDPTAGTCTRSASAVSYNASAACGSFSAAVAIASPGDVIGVKGADGNYPSQTIATNASLRNLTPACDPYGQWGTASTANCVKIVPALGETVTVAGKVEDHASSIWLQGTVTNGVTAPQSYSTRTFNFHVESYLDTEADSTSVYPEHVTMEGVLATQIGTFSATNVYFKNLNAGPATMNGVCKPAESPDGTGNAEISVGYGGGITVMPTGIVWDSVYIHDQTRNSAGATAGCHIGGLFLKATSGFTLENSVFRQDSVYDVQLQSVGAPSQPSNVTLQNNWFACPVGWPYDGTNTSCAGGETDVQFNASGEFDNELIRYNSFGTGISCQGLTCTFLNTRVVGNAGSIPSSDNCGAAGTTWGYNAWVGTNGASATTCGATDVSVSSSNSIGLLFKNSTVGSEDFHLLNTSVAANNLVTPTTSDYALTTDIDGQTRNVPRDAGSDDQ